MTNSQILANPPTRARAVPLRRSQLLTNYTFVILFVNVLMPSIFLLRAPLKLESLNRHKPKRERHQCTRAFFRVACPSLFLSPHCVQRRRSRNRGKRKARGLLCVAFPPRMPLRRRRGPNKLPQCKCKKGARRKGRGKEWVAQVRVAGPHTVTSISVCARVLKFAVPDLADEWGEGEKLYAK